MSVRLHEFVHSTRAAGRAPQVASARRRSSSRKRAKRGEGRPFSEALSRPGTSLIAEHKRRSPSAGEIRKGAKVADIVAAYERGGAAALSILTEEDHFGGSLDDVGEARKASEPADPAQGLHDRPLPALRGQGRGRRRRPDRRRLAAARRAGGPLRRRARARPRRDRRGPRRATSSTPRSRSTPT